MSQSFVTSNHQPRFSLKGVFAASLTPCHPDLSCNIPLLAEHCKELMDRGCSGVLIFGTTGESSSFSVDEKKHAIRSLIERGIDPQRLIVGISSCAIPDAVALAKEATKCSCAAVLITPPYFFKNVDDAGVAAFYRELIVRVDDPALQIILYHIPQFTGVPITIPLIRELYNEFSHHIAGIKESEGNSVLTKEILKQFPGLSLFAGHELHIVEAVRLGAAGSIVGMANLFPELLCSLYEFGRDPEKKDNQDKAVAIREIMKHFSYIPALKGIMERRKGMAWHTLRPPLISLNAEHSHALNEQLSSLNKIV